MSDLVNELAKLLKHFVTRDLMYIIGGSWVVSAFAYLIGWTPNMQYPSAYLLVLVGLSYCVGYAIQEVSSVTHLVKTAEIPPHQWARWLYRRFTGECWKPVPNLEPGDYFRMACSKGISRRGRTQLERTVTLVQVGATGGPCAIVSSVLFLIALCVGRGAVEFGLMLASLFLGISLVVVNWVKSAQLMQQAAWLKPGPEGEDEAASQ